MKGHDTFRQAVDRLNDAMIATVKATELELVGIGLFAWHQANTRIIETVGQRLELNPDRLIDCVAGHGNTSAASIPIALSEARTQGRLHARDKALIGVFGGGRIWGATVVEWGPGDQG